MFLVYNLLFPFLLLLYMPFYVVHILRRGGLTKDFWERFGIFPQEAKERLAALKARPVWIHAVSVGETVEAVSFIARWRERHPTEAFVFTCGTSTGFATARKKLPADVVCLYCPMDCWWMVRHAYALIRPRLVAILEVEIWPNLILQARRRGIPVVMVNGRLSDRSSQGYARWGCVFRRLFRSYALLCVQTPEDAARLEHVIGKDDRIRVVGTVKFDQVADGGGADLGDVLARAFGEGGHPLFCVGSTHPGEEELVCEAYARALVSQPQWRMVLVPRHAERGAEVVKILEAFHLPWQSVAPIPGTTPTSAGEAQVLLVNTTGQLMAYYRAAELCYVGKSLAGQTGGHNIIEPAIFGKAILYGSHMENFRQVDQLFREAKAAFPVEGDNLFFPALQTLMSQPEKRRELGGRALALVRKHRGAIDRTLDLLDQNPETAFPEGQRAR